MSMYGSLDDDLAREVTQIVKSNTNQVYCPVLTTDEAANHLGVDETTALEALTASYEVGYLDKKRIASSSSSSEDTELFVWW